jgi:hypothetical protein
MPNFVIYDLLTGLVQQSGYTSIEVAEMSLPEGLGVLETAEKVDHRTSRVVGESIEQIAPRPSLTHLWVDDGWVEQRTAEELLLEKQENLYLKIKVERERRNALPITYEGALFDADEKGQRNLTAWMVNIASGIPVPPGFVWRDYDNVDHPADAAFIVGLGNSVVLRGTLLYQTAWAKKAEVEAITSLAEVEAYDHTTGWDAPE